MLLTGSALSALAPSFVESEDRRVVHNVVDGRHDQDGVREHVVLTRQRPAGRDKDAFPLVALVALVAPVAPVALGGHPN